MEIWNLHTPQPNSTTVIERKYSVRISTVVYLIKLRNRVLFKLYPDIITMIPKIL